MKTVVLEGKSYTKASEVAAQFGYTSDYIGQLCRGKKIDARLVGRTWFVHLPSVEAHRDQRYAYQKTQATAPAKRAIYNELGVSSTDEAVVDMTSKKYVKRVVPAPLSHRPFRPTSAPSETFFNPRPKYEPDEYVLYPKVAKEPRITLLKVDMAESESLSIRSAKQTETQLRPEPLPEVVLKGSLSVQNIHDDAPESTEANHEEAEPIPDNIRDNQGNKDEVTIHPDSPQTGRALKVSIITQSSPEADTLRVSRITPSQPTRASKPVQTSQPYVYQVAVTRVEKPADVIISSSDESIVKEVAIVSPWHQVQVVSLYVFGFIFAIVSAGTLLMAESEAVATATDSTRGVTLQPASLMKIFEQIWP